MLYKHNDIVKQLSRIYFFNLFAYYFLVNLFIVAGVWTPENCIFNTELLSSSFSFTSQVYTNCDSGGELYISVYAGIAYRHVFKYRSWPKIVRAEKHKSVDHCLRSRHTYQYFKLKKKNGKE